MILTIDFFIIFRNNSFILRLKKSTYEGIISKISQQFFFYLIGVLIFKSINDTLSQCVFVLSIF